MRTKGPNVAASSRAETSVSRMTRGTLSRDLARDRGGREPRLAGLEHEVELQCVGVLAGLHVVTNQGARNAELAVGLEHRIVRIVDLRCNGLVAGLVNEEM